MAAKEIQLRWKRAVAATEEVLGEPVGKLYIEGYFKGERPQLSTVDRDDSASGGRPDAD